MLMGSAFRKGEKPEVGSGVYDMAVKVTSGPWSSCVDSAGPVSGFSPLSVRCCERINLLWTLRRVIEFGSMA